MNAHFFHIGQDGWDLFGTLTFSDEFFQDSLEDYRVGGIRRKKAAFWMLRRIFDKDATQWNRAQWVLRSECGEMNGRPHYHFLVRNLKNKKTIQQHHCYALEAFWEGKFSSMARIRPFHKWIDGASSYCVKEANGYEVRKFGTAIEVEFSHTYNKTILDRVNYNSTVQQEAFHASEVIA